jgi:hypothetical protein
LPWIAVDAGQLQVVVLLFQMLVESNQYADASAAKEVHAATIQHNSCMSDVHKAAKFVPKKVTIVRVDRTIDLRNNIVL